MQRSGNRFSFLGHGSNTNVKLIVVVGIVYGVLILAATVGYFSEKFFGRDLDQESMQYVDAAVPEIVASWKAAELLKRASPGLQNKMPMEEIQSLFQIISVQLGPMKEYRGSEGEVVSSVLPEQGRITTARYMADAVFERAPAKIEIQLILSQEGWLISGFQVSSQASLL